jgi:CRISPR/Cas system-associated exonuclease Cas4 (RecB family)
MIEGVKNIIIEHPIDCEELNVKGYIDMVVETNDGEIFIYDFKTVGSWSWKFKFGKMKEAKPSFHQELQLGTYGYAVKQELGRCDGLALIYYNKDTSVIKQCEVSLDFIDQAYIYWQGVIDSHKSKVTGEYALPPLQEGVAPVMDWECKYCNFKELCDER